MSLIVLYVCVYTVESCNRVHWELKKKIFEMFCITYRLKLVDENQFTLVFFEILHHFNVFTEVLLHSSGQLSVGTGLSKELSSEYQSCKFLISSP